MIVLFVYLISFEMANRIINAFFQKMITYKDRLNKHLDKQLDIAQATEERVAEFEK